MELRTHRSISPSLVGRVTTIGSESATCELQTSPEMAADERGLCHGGFIFGLADFAAMVAVGDPNVVLGEAQVRFVAPVAVSEIVCASATASGQGKKRVVEVICTAGAREVLRGTFTCFVLDHHVLDKEQS